MSVPSPSLPPPVKAAPGAPAGPLFPRLRRFITQRSGVAAVEFAIIAPVFFAVLLGIVIYGLYFGAAHSVQQLAADAARASIAGLNDDERISLARGLIATSSRHYALLDPDKVTFEAGAAPGNKDVFVVTVSYDAANLPIFGFGGLVPTPLSTISRSSAIRRGGY